MKRLYSIKELMEYLSVGRHTARGFAESCNAVVKINGRVLYDIHAIDKAIDDSRCSEEVEADG